MKRNWILDINERARLFRSRDVHFLVFQEIIQVRSENQDEAICERVVMIKAEICWAGIYVTTSSKENLLNIDFHCFYRFVVSSS